VLKKLLQYSNNLHQIIDGNGMYDALIENDSEGIEHKNPFMKKVKSRMDINMEFERKFIPSKKLFQEEYENGKLITGTSTDDNIQYT
jgi:poly-beta-hydroxyalkanoate depolymerase